jgi:subtilisin family serine protease
MAEWIVDLRVTGKMVAAPQVAWSYGVGPVVLKEAHQGGRMPLSLTISDKEKVKVELHPDGDIDGTPQWSVLSGSSTVEPAVDGMSAYLVSENDAPDGGATTEYQVMADVDLAGGVTPLTDTITLHVTEAAATNLGLQAASPEPKP